MLSIAKNLPYQEIGNTEIVPKYNIETLDINETISELSYLTHNYFRYYGKFPSKVGKTIISKLSDEGLISAKNDFIFDNYVGSGTSLVEAKLSGFDSTGVDINPFAILASKVKTYNYSVSELKNIMVELFGKIEAYEHNKQEISLLHDTNQEIAAQILVLAKKVYTEFPDVEKWFTTQAIQNLAVIKYFILQMPLGKAREFFLLSFFAIIRRVSKAFDGEVRPHVNKTKKERDVIAAYEKKVLEMVSTMSEWNHATDSNVVSDAHLCDNTDIKKVSGVLDRFSASTQKTLGLVISHPPYLNCFDYIPVYRLKFLWAFGFDEIYGEMDYSTIKKSELKSYPASTERLIYDYFDHNKIAYQIMYENLRHNGYCCVVIGDCTIQKELFSVHKIFINQLENIGFVVDRIIYRSTSYGLGKYAYKHKADYNEKADGKKDAILFFRKP